MIEELKKNKHYSSLNTRHKCSKHGVIGTSVTVNGNKLETCYKCRMGIDTKKEAEERKKRMEIEKEIARKKEISMNLKSLNYQFNSFYRNKIRWKDFDLLNNKLFKEIKEKYQNHKNAYVFYGGLGTGKTTASYLLAYDYIKKGINNRAIRVKSSQLYRIILSNKNSINDYKEVDLLIIDDFGREGVKTDFFRTIMFEIIDHRTEENKELVTIITTNFTKEQVAQYIEPTRLAKFFNLIEFDKQIRG